MKKKSVIHSFRNNHVNKSYANRVSQRRQRNYVSFQSIEAETGNILTEAGDTLVTEGGDALITET